MSICFNIALFVGGLFFAYNFIDLYGKALYRYDSLLILTKNISAQEVLLKTLIQGYSKEKIINLIKNGIDKSGSRETKLKIFDDSLVFGETKIVFENEKVKDIEYVSSIEMDRFKKLIERIESVPSKHLISEDGTQ